MKTAFIFSGQGAQYPGMGKDLYENFPECRDIFDRADSALGFSLSNICFNADGKEELDKTENCQPGIYALGAAILALISKTSLSADMAAGLSLGEYTALMSAGVFGFTDGLLLLRKRGLYMAEASAQVDGVMSAVLNLSPGAAEEACAAATANSPGEHSVVVSNYNAPGQIVISGERSAVERAEALCAVQGAKRALRLAVIGPYHTKYMMPAVSLLKEAFTGIPLNEPGIPVISNVDGNAYPSSSDVAPTLLKQLTAPVRWDACVRKMLALGADTFVEIGPGKALSAFVKKITKELTETEKEVRIFNIEDTSSFEKTIKELIKRP